MDINALMAELAQYIRLQEEAAATVEALKDQIKAQMTAAGVDTLVGAEHKATYRAVTSSRVDPPPLKKICRTLQPGTQKPRKPAGSRLRKEAHTWLTCISGRSCWPPWQSFSPRRGLCKGVRP